MTKSDNFKAAKRLALRDLLDFYGGSTKQLARILAIPEGRAAGWMSYGQISAKGAQLVEKVNPKFSAATLRPDLFGGKDG